MSSLRRLFPLATLALAISALYFYKLAGIGVVDPDEPRYLAIGRAMAHTGDLVTPRLWGAPWFEKPPLLYWMTALGTLSGLGPELSGRLPVALLSLAFLVASFLLLRREFGAEAAAVSTALLATCAAWLTYTEFALTDLPLAVFFSLAVYLALPLLRDEPETTRICWRFLLIGVAIGLGTLAKGLVPIALALPFFWFLRGFRRNWWLAFAGCAVIALPWYVAVTVQNGYPFIQEFFLKHHFERLYSASLQHVQPWYFYFPVLLGALFPWTPLLALFAVARPRWDGRRRFLAAIVIFGFVFFSISLNKLPGYLLPLLPSLLALLGAQLEFRHRVQFSRCWLAPCALLIAAIPLLASVMPELLIAGRFRAGALGSVTRTEAFYIVVPIVAVFLARRSWAGLLLVLCVVSGGIYLKETVYPVLETQLSARSLWQEIQGKGISEHLCDGGTNRDWIYGLSFYRGSLIAPCGNADSGYVIRSHGHGRPSVEPLK